MIAFAHTAPPQSLWTILGPAATRTDRGTERRYVWAQCACGSPPREVALSKLNAGLSLSCGCRAKDVHTAYCLAWKKRKMEQAGTTPLREASVDAENGTAAEDAVEARRRVEANADAAQTEAAR